MRAYYIQTHKISLSDSLVLPYLAINSLNTMLYRFLFGEHEHPECKLFFAEESSCLGNSFLKEVELFTITEE